MVTTLRALDNSSIERWRTMDTKELIVRIEELEKENEKLKEQINDLRERLRLWGVTVSEQQAAYVGSSIRKTFHIPTCGWACEISPHNLVEFSSHQEAVIAGYEPCKTCRA